MKKINVMVVDDSAVVRKVITETLESDLGIAVIGAAADPLFALERMSKQWPDVIVLDVEMPRMDGITFLKKIMHERPTPIVMCSSLTEEGAATTLQALAAGAVGFIAKPKADVRHFFEDASDDLVSAVKAAAQAKVQKFKQNVAATPAVVAPKLNADAVLSPAASQAMARTTERVVAIGTSTGGTQALELVLAQLPRVCPGMVIVQHMPEKFTAAFAARLDSLCAIEVKEAQNNDRVLPGRALIAPGGKHMLLKRSGAFYHVEVVDGPLVNRHRPSVDVLFRSVAKFAGKNALGIIMRGLGVVGARGMKEMHDVRAYTVAQDEKSSVVYGMPKEAVKLGGVDRSLPLQQISQAIMAAGEQLILQGERA